MEQSSSLPIVTMFVLAVCVCATKPMNPIVLDPNECRQYVSPGLVDHGSMMLMTCPGLPLSFSLSPSQLLVFVVIFPLPLDLIQCPSQSY